MRLKNIKISFIINLMITFFTVVASIIMFTGFKFMNEYETVLESTKIGMLKFFTVESNLFMGIVALFFAIKAILKTTIVFSLWDSQGKRSPDTTDIYDIYLEVAKIYLSLLFLLFMNIL